MINRQQQVSGVSTVDAPAATTNGDNYVLAWAAADQSLWWTTCPAVNNQNSYDWVKETKVPNAASSGGPALANLKGKVWMAWKGEGADPRIFLSSLSGSTWSPGVLVSGIGTSSSPALTVTASELYLVWKGEHDKLVYWSKSSDGKAWSPQAPVPGAASSDTPALAGFKGVVYLAWKGASDNKIWSSEYTDANGWGKANALPSNFETPSGPALGVGNTGNLHVVWKGASDNFVWEAVLNLGKTTWSPPVKIVVIETSARPALASQTSTASEILLAWKGATSSDLWVAPLDGLKQVQLYTFGFDSFQIHNTRSGNILSTSDDTDYASFGLTVNKGTPKVVTQSMGNLSNGVYPTNLAFNNVAIADSDHVVLTYHIINSSIGETNATTYLQQTAFKLASAAAQAAETAASGAIGAALGGLIGIAIPVPIIGSALGALGGWLLGSFWGVAFPDCDGPVASAVHVFTGASLRALAPSGRTYISTENNPGVNSPDGCGSNSNYDVTWSLNVG